MTREKPWNIYITIPNLSKDIGTNLNLDLYIDHVQKGNLRKVFFRWVVAQFCLSRIFEYLIFLILGLSRIVPQWVVVRLLR